MKVKGQAKEEKARNQERYHIYQRHNKPHYSVQKQGKKRIGMKEFTQREITKIYMT